MWLKNTWTAPNWWAHGSQNQFVSNTFPLFPHNQSDRWETKLFRPGNYSSDPFTSCSFIFLKFIKKEISNYLDYFQKHLSDPFGSICIFPNIFARPFLTFLNVYENICMIISDDFEYSWKYLSDPFWRFWIFLNDFLSPEKNSFFLLKLSLEHFWTQGSLMSLGFVQTERLNSICCQVEE